MPGLFFCVLSRVEGRDLTKGYHMLHSVFGDLTFHQIGYIVIAIVYLLLALKG